MLNKVIIAGRLVRDPELKQTNSGLSVCSFTLAVDRDNKSDSGESQTDFIDCTAWRHTAEFVSKWFAKGQMAIVSGRLQVREYTDKDGGKRRSVEVIAENIYFAGSRNDGAAKHTTGYAVPGQPVAVDFTEVDEDGEIPF